MALTAPTILSDHIHWSGKIVKLAAHEFNRAARGTVLGKVWIFAKPLIYIFCFWFALEIGLRASRTITGDGPYILWLMAGMVPWFFMSGVLNNGIDAYHRFSYLVKKVKFPLSAVPTISVLSSFFTEIGLMVVLFIVYFVCAQSPTIYLIQIPILLVIMFLFWAMVAILFSVFSAYSKDFKNFMNAMGTPLFWLSGVIFSLQNINIEWVQTALLFNPITFFVNAFRCALYDHTWFWQDTTALIAFAGVFVFTLIVMLFVYGRLHREVADVL